MKFSPIFQELGYIFQIKIKIASTKIVPNIYYITLFRVEFREQPFWSFGKKLPPEYLVIIIESVGQYIAEKVNLRALQFV